MSVVVSPLSQTVVVNEDSEDAAVVVDPGRDVVVVTADPGSAQVVVTEGMPGPPGPPGSGGGGEAVAIQRDAATALSGHRAVVEIDGEWTYMTNDDDAQLHLRPGVTSGAANQGEPATAVIVGRLEESTWSWTTGAPIYVGTNGLLTQTPPSAPAAEFLLEVGVALAPTVMFVDPQMPIRLA